jgi:hypothetical protein
MWIHPHNPSKVENKLSQNFTYQTPELSNTTCCGVLVASLMTMGMTGRCDSLPPSAARQRFILCKGKIQTLNLKYDFYPIGTNFVSL